MYNLYNISSLGQSMFYIVWFPPLDHMYTPFTKCGAVVFWEWDPFSHLSVCLSVCRSLSCPLLLYTYWRISFKLGWNVNISKSMCRTNPCCLVSAKCPASHLNVKNKDIVASCVLSCCFLFPVDAKIPEVLRF